MKRVVHLLLILMLANTAPDATAAKKRTGIGKRQRIKKGDACIAMQADLCELGKHLCAPVLALGQADDTDAIEIIEEHGSKLPWLDAVVTR